MREIKFRVWTGMAMEYNVLAGKLGVFYVQGLDPKDTASLSQFNTIYSESTPVMQFTGIKDRKNKEIYEGDILICEGRTEKPAVEFYRGCFFVIGNPSCDWDEDLIEVIGNIYEHPHLLNEGAK